MGTPDGRIVLLKDVGPDGFTFFTNYDSAKGQELAANPRATLVFFWAALERQVRASGTVTRVDAAASDTYFLSRPRESQVGAWASPQSQVIADRATLEARMADATARFAAEPMTRPPHWGGYLVTPSWIEFGAAARTACTTACAITAPATPGRSRASPPDTHELPLVWPQPEWGQSPASFTR